MRRSSVILLCLLAALPLPALDNAVTLELTGQDWLSWNTSERMCFLAGVTHGEVNTVIRIGLQLKAGGFPDSQIQSEIFPFAGYNGTLEDLAHTLTVDILASPQNREETLLVLLMSSRWHIRPQESIE